MKKTYWLVILGAMLSFAVGCDDQSSSGKAEDTCTGDQCQSQDTDKTDDTTCTGDKCENGTEDTEDNDDEDEPDPFWEDDDDDDVDPEPDKCASVLCQPNEYCLDGGCVKIKDCNPECLENQKCEEGQCVDDATVIEEPEPCGDNEERDQDGVCQPIVTTGPSMKLSADSFNILQEQTVTIKAQITSSPTEIKDLEWSFKLNTATAKEEAIDTLIEKTLSDDTLQLDISNKTRMARELTVSVKSKSNPSLKATATISLKPYYPYKEWDYYFGGESPRRNLYYEKTKKKDDLACDYYDEHTAHVFNYDIYKEFVYTKLIYENKHYYPTRASVVEAARFLTLLFPFDIPYYETVERGHWVWSTTALKPKACEGRIYGLNLWTKAYNNYRDDSTDKSGKPLYKDCKNEAGEYITVVKDSNTKWGCSSYGLECTGLVTWILRNGRFHLGDWRNALTNKGYRNYLHGKADTSSQHKYYFHDSNEMIGNSNKNNTFDDVMAKFSGIVPETDILDISKMTDEQKKGIKAGDLLYHPAYCGDECKELAGYCFDSKCKSRKSGHAAMILGLTRDSNGLPVKIYVAEARGVAPKKTGNRATQYLTWDDFATGDDSNWSNKNPYPSFIYKMDHVYDYYSRINKLKADANTYKYTDMWY